MVLCVCPVIVEELHHVLPLGRPLNIHKHAKPFQLPQLLQLQGIDLKTTIPCHLVKHFDAFCFHFFCGKTCDKKIALEGLAS